MGPIQPDLSIFNKFNFDWSAVGVKFLLNRPDGLESLDKILAFCKMLPEAQVGKAFYVGNDTMISQKGGENPSK